MDPHDDSVFERLDPPPGGLVALRLRIARHDRRRTRVRRVQFGMAGAALAALLVASWWLPGMSTGDAAPLHELDLARMRWGLLPAPAEPMTIASDRRGSAAAMRVTLEGDDVVFYLIGSVDESPANDGSASGPGS